jgi:hypothetical protein
VLLAKTMLPKSVPAEKYGFAPLYLPCKSGSNHCGATPTQGLAMGTAGEKTSNSKNAIDREMLLEDNLVRADTKQRIAWYIGSEISLIMVG